MTEMMGKKGTGTARSTSREPVPFFPVEDLVNRKKEQLKDWIPAPDQVRDDIPSLE